MSGYWNIEARRDDIDDARANCGLCAWTGSLTAILDHLGEEHDLTIDIAEWPDGEPVIVDQTLEPVDFELESEEPA